MCRRWSPWSILAVMIGTAGCGDRLAGVAGSKGKTDIAATEAALHWSESRRLIAEGRTLEARVVLESIPADRRRAEWHLAKTRVEAGERMVCQHGNAVEAIAFSADGRLLASGANPEITISDPVTAKVLHRIPCPEKWGSVSCLAISHDGKILAASGSPADISAAAVYDTIAKIQLWDTASGKPLAAMNGIDTAASMAFSPDGSELLVGTGDPRFAGVTISFNGKQAYKPGNSLIIVSLPEGRVKHRKDYEHPVHDVRWANHGSAAITYRPEEKTIVSYDRETFEATEVSIARPEAVRVVGGATIALSPLGTLLAELGDADILVSPFTSSDNATRISIQNAGRSVDALRFGRDSRTLVGSSKRRLFVWLVADGTLLGQSSMEPSEIVKIDVDPREGRIATGHADGSVKIWRTPPPTDDAGDDSAPVSRAKPWHTSTLSAGHRHFGIGRAHLITGAEDGSRLYGVTWGGAIAAWDAAHGVMLARHQILPVAGVDIDSVAVAADGRTAAISAGARISIGATKATMRPAGTIGVWDLVTGELRRSLRQDDADVGRSLAISPDGTIVVCAMRRALGVWNCVTGDLLHTLELRSEDGGDGGPAPERVAMLPDGKTIIVAASNRMWKGPFDDWGKAVVGQANDTYWSASCLAVGADGRLVAAGRSDGTVDIWDVTNTPAVSRTVSLPMSDAADQPVVCQLAFADAGARLVGVTSDGTFMVWDTTTGTDVFDDRLGSASQDARYGFAGVPIHRPDGSFAVGSSDGVTIVGVEPIGSRFHVAPWIIGQLGFSPDGQALVATEERGERRVAWMLASGAPYRGDLSKVATENGLSSWQGRNPRARSPDGRWSAAVVDDPRVIHLVHDQTEKP